jgi:hypothetical protein
MKTERLNLDKDYQKDLAALKQRYSVCSPFFDGETAYEFELRELNEYYDYKMARLNAKYENYELWLKQQEIDRQKIAQSIAKAFAGFEFK